MIYLFVSLALLGLGPALAALGRRARGTTTALDAFALVTLGGLVFLHILPHALSVGGLPALIAGAAAFVLTGRAEQSLHDPHAGGAANRLSRAAVPLLALAGLGLHAVIDGAALAGGSLALGEAAAEHAGHDHSGHDHTGEAGVSWIIAVLAHRLPMTVSLWWIVAPVLGLRAAWTTMAAIAAGTTLGFFAGQELMESASPSSLALFEALLCGTLMHVVLHADLPPAPRGVGTALRQGSTLAGLVAGAAVLVAVEASHDHGGGGPHSDPATIFVDLALESAPALLLAYAGLVLMHRLLPAGGLLGGRRRRSAIGEALRGMALGIPLPVCSCGVVPLYRGLVTRGASPVAGVAFLVATPEIELAAILLTVQLLGPEIAVARLLAAALVAVIAALLVARFAARATVTEDGTDTVAEPPTRPTWAAALRHGFADSVDDTAAWIVVGLGLAAVLTPHLDPEWLSAWPSVAAVPLAALLGLPLYVCASGSTPLAAVLIAGGLGPGAAIAFLLTGPATNATTFGVLRRLHGRRTALVFGLAVFLGATVSGWLIDAVLPVGAVAGVIALDDHHQATDLQWICLGAVGLLFVAAVLRRGPRAFLGHVLQSPRLVEIQAGTVADEDRHDQGHRHDHHHH